jgi:hypothetical protein
LEAVGEVWVLRFKAEYLPDPTEMPVAPRGGDKRAGPHPAIRDRGHKLGMYCVMVCDCYHWVRSDGVWRPAPISDASLRASNH